MRSRSGYLCNHHFHCRVFPSTIFLFVRRCPPVQQRMINGPWTLVRSVNPSLSTHVVRLRLDIYGKLFGSCKRNIQFILRVKWKDCTRTWRERFFLVKIEPWIIINEESSSQTFFSVDSAGFVQLELPPRCVSEKERRVCVHTSATPPNS